MSDQKLAAIIEVGPDDQGLLPVDLVRTAYCASRKGTVALLLNGVSIAQVERVLDPVVARFSGVRGVVYCTPGTLGPLLVHRGRPRVASVQTKALAGQLARAGVRLLSPERALREIAGPSHPAGASHLGGSTGV